MENVSTLLQKLYYDTQHPAALGGVKRLSDESRVEGKEVKNWLKSQLAYSLNKDVRKKYPTRKYRVSGLNQLWQMDLMEMIPFAKINKGNRYILTCIDVFSRYARAIPIKRKNSINIAMAVKKLLRGVKPPRYVQTDLGKEFYNAEVQKLFKKHKIIHYSVHSEFKAAYVERFNRTLRERLNRWFTHSGKKIWVSELENIISAYNRSKHKGIFNMRPVDVTHENEMELWRKMNEGNIITKKSAPIPLLNFVRISKRLKSAAFSKKNFEQNWSDEVFQVVGVDKRDSPIMYILKDDDNNIIKGKFYYEELQDIGDERPQVFRIEKIIRSRGTGVHKHYYVKWHGYNSQHNSWISASDITKNE